MTRNEISQKLHSLMHDWQWDITHSCVELKSSTEYSWGAVDAMGGAMVCGGAIPSMLMGDEPKDYDVYLKRQSDLERLIKYYLARWNDTHDYKTTVGGNMVKTAYEGFTILVPSRGVMVGPSNRDNPFDPILITDNAITLANGIQLVTRFTGQPGDITGNFDFVHTQCYYDYGSNELVLPARALESIVTKHLIYTGSKFPLTSIIRTRKFIKRGWEIDAGQYLKMCIQLNELDLRDIGVLREQLIGVDVSYFNEILDKVAEGNYEDNASWSGYLIGLVDEVFG